VQTARAFLRRRVGGHLRHVRREVAAAVFKTTEQVVAAIPVY